MTSKTTYHVMEVSDESASEFPEKYNWENERSFRSFINYIDKHKSFPDFEPFLVQELYPDKEFNKRNDFIFGPIDQYCVSQNVKNLLEEFNLPKHRFFDVTVYRTFGMLWFKIFRTKLNNKYYAFFYDFKPIDDSLDWIDFNKTEIRGTTGNGKIIKLNIASAGEFRQIPIRTLK